jgi:hypothetical protein
MNGRTQSKGVRKLVLRKAFGLKRNEVMGDWRKLHNKDLHDFYSSPNIIPVIKSRRMRCVEHVARRCMGKNRDACRVLARVPEGMKPLGNLGVDGSIILKWVLEKLCGGTGTGLYCGRLLRSV